MQRRPAHRPSAANQGSFREASWRCVSSPLVMAPENHSLLKPMGSSFFSVVSEPGRGVGVGIGRRRRMLLARMGGGHAGIDGTA